MKTTTKNTLAKRVEKLVSTKELNKSTIVYGWINNLIDGEKEFRPVYSQGSSWKNSTLFDRTNELTTILGKLGIEYSKTNDAKRGGKTGVKIEILTKVK